MTVDKPVLDILILPTYSPLSIGIGDFSKYPDGYIQVSPTMEITPPALPTIAISFVPNNVNIYSSQNLGITCIGSDEVPLPDGIYQLKYSIAPAYENFVQRSIIRVDALQEMFDTAFMKLDMFECEGALKNQERIDLNSVYYFIQCSIAAANTGANTKSMEMYNQAYKMLNKILKNQRHEMH